MTDTITGNTVSILSGGMLTTINLPAAEDVREGVDRGDGTLGTAVFETTIFAASNYLIQ